MAQLLSDRRDIDFVLFEQFGLEGLLTEGRYADLNKKTVDLIITEARNLAVNEILPTNADGDRQGCTFENGEVRVPESFHRVFKLFREGEWIALFDDPEVGGQGLPVMVASAVGEYFTAANCAFGTYAWLCHGAGKLVEVLGTDSQKALFLNKMYSGQWGGSMLLTEPEAGSDVGALTTSARKRDDGTYAISGSKIFITGGEQNLTENIIHPVLARIDGAPEGTRGISLFIVPKIWVNEDGSLGEPNDVVCTGIEEKMGIHGSSTCSLTLGGQGNCRGFLLGEENKGMRAMFHMMNEARLGVGIQGFSMSTASFMYAMDYARQRKQGRHLLKMMEPSAAPVPIIQHPDVRRMLLWMKAHVEGMRSFIYYVGNCFDREAVAVDDEQKDKYRGLLEILTPVVKAYCTDKSFEVCTLAVQTYGGYGYIGEYPVEQYLRDCKITSLYEGTNGIQAMDLLGRKMGLKKGAYFGTPGRDAANHCRGQGDFRPGGPHPADGGRRQPVGRVRHGTGHNGHVTPGHDGVCLCFAFSVGHGGCHSRLDAPVAGGRGRAETGKAGRKPGSRSPAGEGRKRSEHRVLRRAVPHGGVFHPDGDPGNLGPNGRHPGGGRRGDRYAGGGISALTPLLKMVHGSIREADK